MKMASYSIRLIRGINDAARATSCSTFNPHHVIHRGHNRQVIFAETEDFEYYLSCLRLAKKLYPYRLYAYVLMTNQVHLLLEPRGLKDLSGVMKRVAGRFTRYMNQKYHRRGTLWEGRFRSAVVVGERYLLAVSRYIEMNPVRARMAGHPQEYGWSSYRAHAKGEVDDGLDMDPLYASLGDDANERARVYEAWVKESVPEGEWEAIREAIRRGRLVGRKKFQDEMAILLGRRIDNWAQECHQARLNKSVPIFPGW